MTPTAHRQRMMREAPLDQLDRTVAPDLNGDVAGPRSTPGENPDDEALKLKVPLNLSPLRTTMVRLIPESITDS